jgi:hypothetical protein
MACAHTQGTQVMLQESKVRPLIRRAAIMPLHPHYDTPHSLNWFQVFGAAGQVPW